MNQDYRKYLDYIHRLNYLKESILSGEDSKLTVGDFEEVHSLLLEFSGESSKYLNDQFELFLNGSEERRAEGFVNWNFVGTSLCATQIIAELQGITNISEDDFEDLVVIYEELDLDAAIKGMGLYLTADLKKTSDAERCYRLQMKAFEIFPKLAEKFGYKYEFLESKIKDTYYEYCPICSGTETKGYYCAPQFTVVNSESGFAPVKLWRKCLVCGNLFAYNFPVSEMENSNGHYTKAANTNSIQPRFPLRIYSDIFNKCKMYTDGKKYLEIGIGNGEMLACAMEMGFDVNAVEICREDCEKVSSALGLDIKCCDFMKFDTDGKYDIIVMGDVLEHVSVPIHALKKAKSLLNTGGVLWLSTPNFNSAFSRLQKFNDPMWNQKNHFTYFSYETLLPFLEDLNLCVKYYDISNRYNGSMELYCVNMDA